MAVTILPKGGSVSIKEKAPTLKKLHVGLGWDVSQDGGDFDLDATAILLGADGKAKAVVYYDKDNQEFKANGETVVKHGGDNLTGKGDGDDETIEMELDKIPAEIAKIAVLVNIYEGKSRGQDFSKVNNSFVRLADADTKEEFARHNLQAEYAGKTGVLVGEFVREANGWKFNATAEGVDGSINEVMVAKNM